MGKFLFKYRSFLPVPYFLFLLFVMDFNWFNFSIGTLITLFGLLIRFFSQGFAGDWMRENDVRADYILDGGLYSILRHPLYLGNFFIGFGFTFISDFYPVSLLSLYSFVFFVYYYLIVLEEEDYLGKKFGEKFIKYRKKTPAILPNFCKWEKDRFFCKRSLDFEKSTYSTVAFILVAFLVKGLLIN